jgi:hypothetical protein
MKRTSFLKGKFHTLENSRDPQARNRVHSKAVSTHAFVLNRLDVLSATCAGCRPPQLRCHAQLLAVTVMPRIP